MKSRQNWFKLLALVLTAALFLVACERPLPGGYNSDAETQVETGDPAYPSEPEGVPQPDVDSQGYPGVAPDLPAGDVAPEAYPADADQPAEPAPEGEVPAAETPAEETPELPAAEITPEAYPADGSQPVEPAPVEAAESPAAETTVNPGTHTVVAGENLYRIGLLYGISWTELAAANGITDPAGISVGQVLIIPTTGDEAVVDGEAAATEEPAPTEAIPETGEAAAEPTETAALPTTYIVQQGDNLFRIGLNFGVNWTEIVAANGIVNNFIYPGQELIIPAPEGAAPAETTDAPAVEAPAETPVVSGVTHIVEPGETVFGIAFQYGIPWTTLVEANAITSPYTLEAGQSLIVPES